MEKLRVVVTGLIGSIPLAGLTAHYLQYVLGLRDLGHEVLYLEDTGTWYYDPRSDSMVESPRLAISVLDDVMAAHGLSDRWTFVDHENETRGVDGSRLNDFLGSADIFINVTGAGLLRDEYRAIPRRVYVDTDPGYVQMRAAAGSDKDVEHLSAHNSHFTFGCNVGDPRCSIPTIGLRWRPTVQPIFLPLWPMVGPPPEGAPFTTIMKWKVYEPTEFEGSTYGLKDAEFNRFIELPSRTSEGLELAMAGDAPIDDLASMGWRCRSGPEISRSITSYRRYIQDSKGEWSIAKNGYVKSWSGWFSERSAVYLASGRPVMLQSTGYDAWLPTGSGLFAFSGYEDIDSALEEMGSNYQLHSSVAREIARDFFDSRIVLSRLLDAA